MFLCDACTSYRSIRQSFGTCEDCGTQGVCNDAPSAFVPGPHVALTFSVESDEDAARVSAVLDALGYATTRVADIPAKSSAELGVQRLAAKYGLKESEQRTALAIVQGALDRDTLAAALGCDRTNAKWLRHCVLTRLNVGNNAELLAAALGVLDEVSAPSTPKRPAPNPTRPHTRLDG